MKTNIQLALIAALALAGAWPAFTQTAADAADAVAPLAASAPASVPRLVSYSGRVLDENGHAPGGRASITFLVFKDREGGDPLFAETQQVHPDEGGRYRVLLGATYPGGIPARVFAGGEARWLEVQVAGRAPQPRTLLSSVPYALKAADAATLGGLPASAFLRADAAGTLLAAAANSGVRRNAAGRDVTSTGGAAGFVPKFTGATTIGESEIFNGNGAVGIGTTKPGAKLDVNGAARIEGTLAAADGETVEGGILLPAADNAVQRLGQNSANLLFQASSFSSTKKAAIPQIFEWQAEATGNGTASASGTLNLLAHSGSGAPAETGFFFNPDGTMHFAQGQTFPGAGAGTITGVTAGTGLLGGGIAGSVTLNVDPTKVVSGVTAGTGLTGGGMGGNLTLNVDPTKVVTGVTAGTGLTGGGTGGAQTLSVDPKAVPLLGARNLFTASSNEFAQDILVMGQGTFGSTITAGTGGNRGGLYIPSSPQTFSSSAGQGMLSYPLDMMGETLDNAGQLQGEDFQWRVEPQGNASSMSLLFGAIPSTPAETGFSINSNGAVNAPSLSLSQPAGTIATPVLTIQADENADARFAGQQLMIRGATRPNEQLLIGYVSSPFSILDGYGTIQATAQNISNTALMLQPNGGCLCIRTANTVPNSDPVIVGQGQGPVIADGYAVYSSRRYKTDIQTLPDALQKVEKLRGVSYTLKATGKHEIGVIAEEVGKVVPEVVDWEANGKDARSVDYSRLTALLIEATKQQQAEIAALTAKLAGTERQVRAQQTRMRRQEAAMKLLAARAGVEPGGPHVASR